MAGELVKVRYGKKAQLPSTKDDNTLYFVTDSKQIYRGDVEYTGNIETITLGEDSATANGTRTLEITFKDGTTPLTCNILNSKAVEAILSVLNNTATDITKGLVTLSDSITSQQNATKGGVAATPKAVYDALEAAKNYADEQILAGFAANDAMVFKGTIAADGTINSQDTAINGKKIGVITGYSTGWTFRATATSTSALWSNDTTTKVEAGDMIVAVKDYGTTNTASDWSIVQSNLIGAVTTDSSALTADQLVVGNGTQKVKILAAGSAGQVLTIVNGKPAWATLPTEKDTTYTFTDGTDGSFTVTPLGGTPQNVSIGKPFEAVKSDKADQGLIDGTYKNFGSAAAKNVSSTVENNDNVITSAAVYDALLWKNFNE